jgi:hypothetical protein
MVGVGAVVETGRLIFATISVRVVFFSSGFVRLLNERLGWSCGGR